MHIIADATSDALAAAMPMRLQLADLGGEVAARLTGSTLYLDPTASADDQLFAIADAARFLATGRAEHGRRVRHLRAVPVGRPGDRFREETSEPITAPSVTSSDRILTEVTR